MISSKHDHTGSNHRNGASNDPISGFDVAFDKPKIAFTSTISNKDGEGSYNSKHKVCNQRNDINGD
eukprot:CAMPEP_0114577238 /NCGR_PEP_ID=MMETSP0125-20121206/1920_1 /TAXON_ID=485358 ORGANISM="Aristerostoma sp., Strain ATCC 50986" /NCGR_SAMPLE_ID=MMETSP0125 /ASSEMBLY_ACC=CAM_ASM_000245 /LENGTH=65 /DNA_ID=CAMNT_0001766393 /DNA_START=408 /DNA_END=605 /DNA_ORIENTATION=-